MEIRLGDAESLKKATGILRTMSISDMEKLAKSISGGPVSSWVKQYQNPELYSLLEKLTQAEAKTFTGKLLQYHGMSSYQAKGGSLTDKAFVDETGKLKVITREETVTDPIRNIQTTPADVKAYETGTGIYAPTESKKETGTLQKFLLPAAIGLAAFFMID